MGQRIDVVISSTTKDLNEHRDAAKRAIERAGMHALVMETGTAADTDAIGFSLALIDDAEIYVGIFASRYGYIPDNLTTNPKRLSVTELEYRRALECKLPILIFEMTDDHPIIAADVDTDPEKVKKLKALRDELTAQYVVGFFKSPEHLETLVLQALTELKPKLIESVPTARRGPTGRFPNWQLDLPIIGREADLKTVRDWLAANNRLVTVLGLGGVGKTRLAAEIANTAEQWPSGVIWLDLVVFPTLDALTGLIRDHLKLPIETKDDQVWAALNDQPVLIVLDNFETCKEPAAFVERLNLINLSGGTRTIVTSRTELSGIRNQTRYTLRQPEKEAAAAILQAMIDKENPSFAADADIPALAKAAHYHPRLMQYAVSWLNARPAQTVLTTLQTLNDRDAEQALEEMVLKTVAQVRGRTDGEASIVGLRRLAVCRGGFTYEAGLALLKSESDAEADPRLLGTLKGWNLVTAEGARYDVDPLVVAAVKEDETAYQVHYDYYIALARKHDGQQDYAGLDPDSANLEIAFERALVSNVEAVYWLANACYNFQLNRGRVRQRMAWLQRVEARMPSDVDDRLAAALQNSLGNAYRDLAEIEDRAVNVRRAVAAYAEALRFATPEVAPLDYAGTQNNLGNTYHELAEIEDRAGNLQRAIAAYTEALRFYILQAVASYYAGAQNNLGLAYWGLAEIEDRAANLQRAIAAYTEALRFWAPQDVPLDYAMTQNNLGLAYWGLAEIEDRAANLQRAIAAYTEALRFRTPQAAPLDYARTQANLGVVLEETGDLAAAITCWREAEKYYRRMDRRDSADQVLKVIADRERRLGSGAND